MLGRFEEAVASYDQALALNPRDPVTLTNRGRAQLSLNRHSDALASFDAALGIAPGFQPAMDVPRQCARDDAAERARRSASYDRALALNPNDVVALANRGNVLSGAEPPCRRDSQATTARWR